MSNVEEYAKQVIDIVDLINDVNKQVIDSYLSMFNRFCPFRIGDRVRLIKTLDISPDSGWYHHRHFLTKDSPGTVVERGYSDGRFTFYVTFDNETWIDSDGNKNPVENLHWFALNEHLLERIAGERDGTQTIYD